ncbi:transposase, partial [Limosilactobacillus reuteri]|uniref:transposase n=1 Tax=Limosilactobacillus reuteri TaxID=1598 RepID=UPI003BAF4D08
GTTILSFRHRVVIETLHSEGRSLRYIANYQAIEQRTGTPVYFAHAYSPHERGSNENRNRVLRWFIPKGQAIEKLSDYQLVQINWYLNSRPLKFLNWHTPIEIFLLNLRY